MKEQSTHTAGSAGKALERAAQEGGGAAADPLAAELAQTKRCIGDLTMENELLRERVEKRALSG